MAKTCQLVLLFSEASFKSSSLAGLLCDYGRRDTLDPGCIANLTIRVALGAVEVVVSSPSLEVLRQGLGVWLDDLKTSV